MLLAGKTVVVSGVGAGLGHRVAETVVRDGGRAVLGAGTAASYDAHGDPETAARSAVSGWVEGNGFSYSQSGFEDITATVAVKVPSLVPGIGPWTATRSATMPRE